MKHTVLYTLRSSITSRWVILVLIGLDNLYPELQKETWQLDFGTA